MKLPLSFQLNLGFVLALLLALGVAGSAWWIAHEHETGLDVAFHDQIEGTIQLAEAESALWQLRYGFPQFMIGDAATQRRILEEEPKWYALIAGRLDAYEKRRRSDEELQALAVLRAEYARYIAARPRFFELWQAGRQEEATGWRALTTTPYGAATVAAFARQIELLRAANDELHTEEDRIGARVRLAVTAITVALVALLAGGYWMGRRMLDPIRRLRDEAVATVREQFGENLDISAAGNEVRALEMSLSAMTARFKAHTVELTQAQEALARQSEALEDTVAARTDELEHTVARMARQNLEITLRNELGDLLQSCVRLDEAGAVIARFVPRLFEGASGAAYLMTPGTETLAALSRWGGAATAEVLATADCWAIRRGKTHLVTAGDTSLLCPHVDGLPAGSAGVCMPLSAHGEALGLLHMTCPDACRLGSATMLEKQELAEALAAQVGMALANLRLRETLHQQSIHDALTGLYNRRYLEGALVREISRAQRGNRSLAVFMLDIDHFKHFNDSYGHDAGDAVLRALGKVFRDNCRQADIACRFGGEEFTLVLPDAGEPAAREWAERLMQRVRSMEVKTGGQTLPKITVSMGLALLPAHGNDAETLLQAADLALYDAKHAGRDRLVVSGEAGHPLPNPLPSRERGPELPSPLAGEGPGERGEGEKS